MCSFVRCRTGISSGCRVDSDSDEWYSVWCLSCLCILSTINHAVILTLPSSRFSLPTSVGFTRYKRWVVYETLWSSRPRYRRVIIVSVLFWNVYCYLSRSRLASEPFYGLQVAAIASISFPTIHHLFLVYSRSKSSSLSLYFCTVRRIFD